MGQASLATFYVVFALLTIYLNLESIATWDANAIYRTLSAAFIQYPFESAANASKYMDEVQNIEELHSWVSSSLKPVIFHEQEDMSVLSAWPNMTWSHSLTPATIGSFNRIVMLRFTFKRWAVEKTIGQFQPSTPYKFAGGVSKLDAYALNAAEEKAAVCMAGSNTSSSDAATKCLDWQTGQSFDRAGGYTLFFDPLEGQAAYDDLLTKMRDLGLFDMLLGTFTIDMIVYNANVEMFMQYVQSFAFDFSGHVQMSNDARSFNLNVFNTSVGKYMTFYVMRITCVVMLMIFLLIEFRRMWDLGFFAHFRQQGAVTDMVSISVSLGVFISYWIVEEMPPFKDFKFETLLTVNTRADTYVSLCDVARSLQIQGLFIALNLLVVSLRTVSLVSGLHSNLGLILKVIGVSAPNFAAFMMLFGMLQVGFVLTSFFAFGAGYSEMSDIGLCVYKSFSMLSGDMIFDEISRVDNILGPIYFFSFYILFYLVLINIFVTLLMSGYDIVDYQLQKKGLSETEKNPIVLIFEELKADVIGNILRYGTTVFKYARICLDPIVVSVKACCCFPAPSIGSFGGRAGALRGATLADGSHQSRKMQAGHDPDKKFRERLIAFATMVSFMAVWIGLMTLQGRGIDSYLLGQTTLAHSTLDIMFSKNDNMKAFDQINTFSDVKTWADAAIVGLYNDPVCAESSNGANVWTNNTGCNSSSNSQQLLNRIADWNIGFLNTTFVRLTIQPACFVATEARWASGSPTLRKTNDVECWNSVCTEVLSTQDCRTADGEVLTAQSLANSLANASNVSDTFSFGYDDPGTNLGPFQMLGGLAFSLGVTKDECKAMLALLNESRWFTENSASMVFDWLSYNGNMDLFTQNIVAFSLLDTGVLRRSSVARTFPMNVDAGGGYFNLQTLVLVLFGIYSTLLLYHIIEMCRHVAKEFAEARRMQKSKNFMVDFLSEPWNVAESLSLGISLATFVSFLVWVLNPFRGLYVFSMAESSKYVVPNEEVKLYGMPQVVDPVRFLEDDWYFFSQFERIQSTYAAFLELAALNSLFIALKTIKIVNQFGVVSKFSSTLANGRSRNLYFIIVINLQMSGFALAMTVIFGTMVEEFSSPMTTMGALLYWVCGSSSLRPLMSVSPTLAVIFFVAFMVVFRFISTNMFLATQLNTFAALVGQRDIQNAKKEANAKMGMKQVKYHNRKELQDELELERQSEDQVIVKKIFRPGLALQAHVKPGDVVSKVNKQKVEWQTTLGDEEYEHIERALVPEQDGSITIMFQDPPRKTLLAKLMHVGCVPKRRKVKPGRGQAQQEAYAKPPALRPSVRNFWRFHGAVAEVEKDSQLYRAPDEDHEESGSDAEVDENATPEEMARMQAKKRLHGYLFSRWPNKCRKSSSGINLESLGKDDSQLLEEDIMQDGWDVDELTEAFEQMPVTGQEVWLDCLLLALEEEVLDESPIVEVLRTTGLQDASKEKLKGPAREKLLRFYRRLDQVVRILENKAFKRYFQNLQTESEQRQLFFQQQNEVLHDYVCELENEFSQLSGTIHNYRTKKKEMIKQLAGLIDPEDSMFVVSCCDFFCPGIRKTRCKS